MMQVEKIIEQLYETYSESKPDKIIQLPQSGSNRIYFRVIDAGNSYIATYNLNKQENRTFIYFSKQFKKIGLPVPEILASNETGEIYLQQDLGDTSLLEKLDQHQQSEYIFSLYCKSLEQLAKLQICGNDQIDYNYCLTAKEFGKQAIMSDLLYFKYYFLDTLQLPYDKQLLLDDFELLSSFLSNTSHKYFMFRDFQSRNIIVNKDEVYFIDYQGGMQGALQYDVASLLWQAKAALSEDWKNKLLHFYIDSVEKYLKQKVDREKFIIQYNGYVLIRLLQVLGAYGFRGLFERKAHFLSSIPVALENLRFFVEHMDDGIKLPELDFLLKRIVQEDIIKKFQPIRATALSPLIVEVSSFSYKKGIPEDASGNGGGFVFDCRGILNPGRFEEYKTLSGKDKPVIDFLEQKTQMNNFLNGVFNVVGLTVENYLQRGFSDLCVNFGCTGGQHRSVYAAEQTARFLRNKYHVKVRLSHSNEHAWLKEKEVI